MSLADLIPILMMATRIERRTMTRAEIQRRYRIKNRARLNAYRREWRALRRTA
jgi:hypothetical protein